jgi:hypothetical protein
LKSPFLFVPPQREAHRRERLTTTGVPHGEERRIGFSLWGEKSRQAGHGKRPAAAATAAALRARASEQRVRLTLALSPLCLAPPRYSA